MSNRQFSDVPLNSEAGELPDYRPISSLALVALLAGLASALAMVHPELWCLPIVGVVIAALALRNLALAERPMVGRKAALAGLALSLLFGAAAPARFFSQQFWLASRADHLAQQWFAELGAGRIQAAYDLMLHTGGPSHPPPKSHDAALAAAAEEIKTELQLFSERQPIAKLLALGAQAQPERLAADVLHDELGRDTVVLFYVVRFPGADVLHPLAVQMQVERRHEPGGERWLIGSVTGSRT